MALASRLFIVDAVYYNKHQYRPLGGPRYRDMSRRRIYDAGNALTFVRSISPFPVDTARSYENANAKHTAVYIRGAMLSSTAA